MACERTCRRYENKRLGSYPPLACRKQSQSRWTLTPEQLRLVMMSLRFWIVLVAVAVLISGCDTTDTSPGTELRYFEFVDTTHDETFVAATTDPEVIETVESQLAKPKDERNLHINGAIARGERDYNPGYPWHFVEGEWALAEISTEVCDGRPAALSENLDYWVDEVGRFCPWSSQVKKEVDPPK